MLATPAKSPLLFCEGSKIGEFIDKCSMNQNLSHSLEPDSMNMARQSFALLFLDSNSLWGIPNGRIPGALLRPSN
jgi:hypothetical protein